VSLTHKRLRACECGYIGSEKARGDARRHPSRRDNTDAAQRNVYLAEERAWAITDGALRPALLGRAAFSTVSGKPVAPANPVVA
jgi:hypothetical protein